MRKKLLTRANKAQHLRHNTRKSNMKNFLKSIAAGPRIILVTGHFGSGKTEFSVSLAFALAAMRDEGVASPLPSLSRRCAMKASPTCRLSLSATSTLRIRISEAVNSQKKWRA